MDVRICGIAELLILLSGLSISMCRINSLKWLIHYECVTHA
jgi:hypothetical protein